MKSPRLLLPLFSLFALVLPAEATLLSVTGPNSLLGGMAAIIAPPADVNEDAASNIAQQGFDEVQGFTLLVDLVVDSGTIAAGTTVNSHMIFLNYGPGNNPTLNTHEGVNWTFDGEVLGVMSEYTGSLEVASSSFLGAPGVIYPGAAFNARGMEVDDSYSFLGSVLTVNMRVREPGDWIRVITAGQPIPEPTSLLLLGGGLLGLYGRKRRAAK